MKPIPSEQSLEYLSIDINRMTLIQGQALIDILVQMPLNAYVSMTFCDADRPCRQQINTLMNRINYYRNTKRIPGKDKVRFFVRTAGMEKRLYKMNSINVTENQ